MALTYTPITTEQKLPDFMLTTVDKKTFSAKDIPRGSTTVILFICNHCPYVQAIEERMIQLATAMKDQPVQFIGICSNDHTDHPEDHPDKLLERWKNKNYGFPYLVDNNQEVAKAFGAVCTPDIFVFDVKNNLTYRGRFDDSWKDASKVTKQDLKEAILKTLQGQKIDPQIPSMGCSIKWNS